MPAFLLAPWFLKTVIYAAIAIAVGIAVHMALEHFRQEGRDEIQAKWDADTKRRIAATTAITMLWDQKRIEAEKATTERDHEREGRLADRLLAARALPAAIAGAHFPGVAARVLNDAARDSAAAAEPAGASAGKDAAGADDSDATVGAVAEWGVQLIGMYETCRARVEGWQSFYAALQAAQPKEVSQ